MASRSTFRRQARGSADFSSATNPVKANLATGVVTLTSTPPTDSISGIATVFGSTNGGNTFTSGTTSETFGDLGTGTLLHGGDTVDFSNVPAIPATPLTINASGGGSSTYVATFGGVTDSFAQNGPNFTSFIGSAGGNTIFDAGGTGGYVFQGKGNNNSVDFSADASPVLANLSTSPLLSVGPNQVRVAAGTCPTACDNISGIATVTGSTNGGNTFVAGPGFSTETFKGGPNNSVNFSNLAGSVVVNVSAPGQSPQSTAYGTATSSGTVYDFSNFVSTPTTFVGSPSGTTFYAGSVADSFIGHGGAFDTLSFADAQASTLVVSVGPSGTALLGGNISESFGGIKVFTGLSSWFDLHLRC